MIWKMSSSNNSGRKDSEFSPHPYSRQYLQDKKDYLMSGESGDCGWINTLLPLPEIIDLSFSGQKRNDTTGLGELTLAFSDELSERINAFAQKKDKSVFQIIFAGMTALSGRATGIYDLIQGILYVPKQGKSSEKPAKKTFADILPCRIQAVKEKDFSTLLDSVSAVLNSGKKKRNLYSFRHLAAEIKKKTGHDLGNWINVLLVENISGLPDKVNHITSVPLILYVNPQKRTSKETLEIKFIFHSVRFSREQVDWLFQALTALLEDTLAFPEKSLEELRLLSKEDERKIIHDFNPAENPLPIEDVPMKCFKEVASRIPDALALVHGEKSLSYRELDKKTDALAAVLRTRGIGPESKVALLAERSMEAIVGIFGILKAGAAYVPISTDFPDQRILFIIKDSGALLTLATECFTLLKDSKTDWLDLNDPTLYSRIDEHFEPHESPSDLAYIIYTSGTTGLPKGVMIERYALMNMVCATELLFGAKEKSKALQTSSLCFDASVVEIFLPLLKGLELHIISDDFLFSPERLNVYIKQNNIKLVFLTTALAELFMREIVTPTSDFTLVLGGEKLRQYRLGNFRLFNIYGPTENTVLSSAYEVTGNLNRAPIGKPVANTRAYVLDEKMRPLPPGIPGELYVAGANLSRAYLNRPELNAEKFLPDPFRPGERMYRTGDLVRWLPDGNLDFIERIDLQVKIRGFRIELGEIEQQIMALKLAKNTAVKVLYDQNNDPYLCAYLESPDPDISIDKLKTVLSKILPKYMIPSKLVSMEKLPLNANGKIDRKSLPLPEEFVSVKEAGVAPRNEMEKRFCEMWQDLLHIESVDIKDDFFSLGGHSMLAIKFAMQVEKEFGIRIQVKELFDHPTVAEIVEALTTANKQTSELIEKLSLETLKGKSLPISRFQRKFWLTWKIWPESPENNYCFSYDIYGKLDIDLLVRAFLYAVKSHETFRSIYSEDENGEARMFPDTGIDPEVRIVSSEKERFEKDSEACIQDFIREFTLQPYKLNKKPPIRLGIMKITDEHHIVVLGMHHIIADGVSAPIVPAQWALVYNAFLQKEPPPDFHSDLFAEYIDKEPELFPADNEMESSDFLMRLTEGVPAHLELPYSKNDKAVATREAVYFEMDEKIITEAKKIARSCHSTLFSCYTAVFSALVMRYTKKKSSLLVYQINRRPSGFSELLSVFVDSLPLRADMDTKMSLKDIIRSLTEQRKETRKYKSCLFEDFLVRLQKERGKQNTRNLFNIGINQSTLTSNIPLPFDGLNCVPLAPPATEMWMELLLEVDNLNEKACRLCYNGRLLSDQFAKQTVRDFKKLFELTVRNPENSVFELSQFACIRRDENAETSAAEKYNEPETVFPTHMQRRLWFLHKMEGNNAYAYNSPFFFELNGTLDINALEFAIGKLIERQESLRTVFPQKQGVPYLVVLSPSLFRLLPETITEAELDTFMEQEARRSFDLERGPLFVPRLLRIAGENEGYFLSLNFHHIITDAWSLDIIMSELEELYTSKIECRLPNLPELPFRYKDFALRQNKLLEGEKMREKINECARYLKGSCNELVLFPDKPSPEIQSFAGAAGAFFIDSSLRDEIETLRKSAGVSPFVVFLAAFGALLRYYTGEDDILIGVPAAGREEDSLSQLVGFFVNTVAVRLNMSADPTFNEFLKSVRASVGEALGYQDVPIDQIVRKLQIERRTDRTPLVQVMFSLQDTLKEKFKLPNLSMNLVLPPRNVSLFNLTLELIPVEKGLLGLLEYSTNLFNSETASRITAHYVNLLRKAIQEPDSRLSRLPVMTAEEYRLVLGEMMSGARIKSGAQRIFETISVKAAENPHKTAVVLDKLSLTREDLEIRSNKLARYIQKCGLKKGDLAGIAMIPTIDMIPVLLALMKAGAVIVPLDPQTPEQRTQHILATANLKLLITTSAGYSITAACKEAGIIIIDLDTAESAAAEFSSDPLDISVEAEAPLYIIYTSGTTGKPKGVLVSHKGFEKHCQACIDTYALTPEDRVLQFAPIFFDAGFEQIFPALMAGATLIMRGETPWTAIEFYKNTSEFKLTLVDIPPLYIRELLNYWNRHPEYVPQGLRLVLTGGEALPVDIAKQWLASPAGDVPLLNVYGPTEGIVTSTCFRVHSNTVNACATPSVPIGRPMPGRILRILDSTGNPVPPGVPGELCIGGECLAEAYYHEEELSSRFFRFWTEKNGHGRWLAKPAKNAIRLYRTGDKVRLTDYGVIEFLGRLDRQIKLRGFRIEPGEIESALCEHPEISKTCVILHQDETSGESFLVAYIVALQPTDSLNNIRIWLQDRIPSYMIPQSIVFIPEIPVTPAGKIDEKSLPPPAISIAGKPQEKESPASDKEKAVAAIWKRLLNSEHVGRYDNFFDLGGHSLLLIRLHAYLTEELGANLDIIDLFRYPTVAAQARAISGKTAAPEKPISSAVYASNDIAVIGMAGCFPDAEDIDTFWRNLEAGKESISFFSREQLLSAGFSPEQIDNPDFVAAHGILKDAERFDAEFFDFTPRETSVMDPQHRVFLEIAWHTLEHGGYDPFRYPGKIGVFAGSGMNTYLIRNLVPNKIFEKAMDLYQLSMGNDKDFIPTRVSYKFNLRGPSVNINTACSTSLVAIHLACKSLLAGECEMALAGGVSIHIPQVCGYVYQQNGIASPDGHCRAFAEDAAGTIGGNGAGAVLLKRLENAIADGDTIHAVIKGSGINNDGSAKMGFTAPGVEGQRDAILSALSSAGVSAESISYLEAHGTGTALGDPIEIKALTEAYRKETDKCGFCAVGAVKSNVGHLDAAAGIAGFIKAVSAIENKKIPQTLHCEKTNPQINFPETPFFTASKPLAWDFGSRPRRAGISSFGMGGTNAHIIIEEAPEQQPSVKEQGPFLLPISARSKTALLGLAESLARHLESNPDINLADVSYTLATGRACFKCRLAVISNSTLEAISFLRNKSEDTDKIDISSYPEIIQQLYGSWMAEEEVDWNSLFSGQKRRRLPLPLYPYQRQRYWVDPPKPDKESSESPASVSGLEKQQDISRWFSVPSWKRSPSPIPSEKKNKALLVLHSGSPVEKQVLEYLRKCKFKMSVYEYASPYNDYASDRIDPLAADDMVTIFEQEENQKKTFPSAILYLALLAPLADNPAQQRLEYAKKMGISAPMTLARALSKTSGSKNVEILFVCSELHQVRNEDVLVAEKQLLSGPGRVIPQEYKNLKCRIIDLELSKNGQLCEESLELLNLELQANAETEQIALRKWRWEQDFSGLRLGTAAHSAGIEKYLRNEGIYFITGGLGGIGMTLVGFIAENVRKVKLVLVSRSPFPERNQWPKIMMKLAGDQQQRNIIEKIFKWEELGAETLILTADVADSKRMKEIAEEVSARFGKINAIIHTAGVPGGSLIAETDEEEINRVLNPKVNALLTLEEILDIKSLDFMVLCSSLNSLLGGVGQVVYTAANMFLNAFAMKHAKHTKVVSIAWDTWKDVGMAVRAAKGEFTRKNARKSYPMTEVLNSMSISPSNYWPLGEHKIGNKYTLPGTAYLDMAYTTLKNAGFDSIHLENFSIRSPLEMSEEKTDSSIYVRIGISRDNSDSYSFGIHREDNGFWIEHAKGKGSSLPDRPGQINLKDLKNRCFRKISEDSVNFDDGIRIEASKRWEFPVEAFFGDGEAIAFLELPDNLHKDLKEHPLHPALLDRATAFMLADIKDAASFLPFQFGAINIFAPLSSNIISYVRQIKDESSVTNMLFDIVIMNSDGNILMEIKRYSMLRASGIRREDKSDSKPLSPMLRAVTDHGIAPSEGADIFARILGSYEEPVVYVCTSNLDSELEQARRTDWKIPGMEALSEASGSKQPRPPLSTPFRKPEGVVETTVARIWSDLLGISGIGLDDDLFELGADSLLAIQAVSRLSGELSFSVSVDRFFETPTIAGLAGSIPAIAIPAKRDNKADWEEGEI